MNSAVEEELKALRSRAYGPDSDIARDPVALRRLDELEALRRGGGEASTPAADAAIVATDDAAPTADAVPTSKAAPTGVGDGVVPDDPMPPGDAATVSEEPAASARPRATPSRRTTLLWVVSCVASAAFAASATAAALSYSPVSASAGAPQIAALEPTSSVEIPPGFLGVGPSSAVFEFAGLTIFESNNVYGVSGGTGTPCMTVVTTDQIPAVEDFDSTSWGFNGPILVGCRVGAFPATVQVAFTSDLPEELRERFPSGRAIQFVLGSDGDTVGVFLDTE